MAVNTLDDSRQSGRATWSSWYIRGYERRNDRPCDRTASRGAHVIALTGVAFELDPRIPQGPCPTGKALHEAADVVVDLGNPPTETEIH